MSDFKVHNVSVDFNFPKVKVKDLDVSDLAWMEIEGQKRLILRSALGLVDVCSGTTWTDLLSVFEMECTLIPRGSNVVLHVGTALPMVQHVN